MKEFIATFLVGLINHVVSIIKNKYICNLKKKKKKVHLEKHSALTQYPTQPLLQAS